jgi:hypothetical protein
MIPLDPGRRGVSRIEMLSHTADLIPATSPRIYFWPEFHKSHFRRLFSGRLFRGLFAAQAELSFPQILSYNRSAAFDKFLFCLSERARKIALHIKLGCELILYKNGDHDFTLHQG